MPSAWAKDLPVVTVAHGETAKPVTLVYPYYECPAFFRTQFAHWYAQSFAVPPKDWSIVVVDDGSPKFPAREALPQPGRVQPPWFRLFRIEPDVPWNWLAARNIGAHHAADGWLLLTDMDHVVNEPTLKSVIYGQHDPNVVYAFSRVEHTGEVVAPHSASFLMTKAMFWKIGGYDEELSGRYGTDGDFRRRLKAVAQIQVLTDDLVRYEYVGDSSTTRYPRKRPEDEMAVRRIVASRWAGWRPRTLSFTYQEVTC